MPPSPVVHVASRQYLCWSRHCNRCLLAAGFRRPAVVPLPCPRSAASISRQKGPKIGTTPPLTRGNTVEVGGVEPA